MNDIEQINILISRLCNKEPIEALALLACATGDLMSRMSIDDDQREHIIGWLARSIRQNEADNRLYRATVAAARANGGTPVFDLGEYRRSERPQERV